MLTMTLLARCVETSRSRLKSERISSSLASLAQSFVPATMVGVSTLLILLVRYICTYMSVIVAPPSVSTLHQSLIILGFTLRRGESPISKLPSTLA